MRRRLVNLNFLGKTNRARTSEKGAGWEEEDSATHNLAVVALAMLPPNSPPTALLLGICLTSAFQTTHALNLPFSHLTFLASRNGNGKNSGL